MQHLSRTPMLLEYAISGAQAQQTLASRSVRSGSKGGSRKWTGSPGDIGVGRYGLDPYYGLGSRLRAMTSFGGGPKSKTGEAARKAIELARMHLMITPPRPYSYAS